LSEKYAEKIATIKPSDNWQYNIANHRRVKLLGVICYRITPRNGDWRRMLSEMSVLHTGQRAHPAAVEVMF